MKITIILPIYWPAVGGCEIHTHELVKRLSEKHDVRVLTLLNDQADKSKHEIWFASILMAPQKAQYYKDHNAEVVRLPLSSKEKMLVFPFARIQSPKIPRPVRNVAMEILQRRFENVLSAYIGDCDVIHCVHGGVSYLGYASLNLARKKSKPFVYTPLLHPRQSESGSQLHIIPRGWNDEIWLNICHKADALLTMTEYERDYFITSGIPGKKIMAVGVGPVISENGDETKFLERHNVSKNGKVVLFLGRNHESKGIDSLLKSARIVWERFPDTYFFFVGPQEGISKQIFSKFTDNRIIKTGEVDLSEKTAALKACDIFCMPSLEESFGGVFLEAWSFGKPVIGGDIPPVRELIEDRKGGFVVNSTPAEIADRIITLLGDEALRRKMGEWGKAKVHNNFTWDVITKKVEGVYTRCLGGEG